MSPAMLSATGVVRGLVAAVLLIAFMALWLWAYSGRRRALFERLSRLPLEDDNYGNGEPAHRGDLVCTARCAEPSSRGNVK